MSGERDCGGAQHPRSDQRPHWLTRLQSSRGLRVRSALLHIVNTMASFMGPPRAQSWAFLALTVLAALALRADAGKSPVRVKEFFQLLSMK